MLALVAVMLGANVVTARLAMDSGADVASTVAVRSLFTALMAAAMVARLRIPMRLGARHRRAMPLICLLVGVQSLCLYAAVSRMPVALAVLIFNTHPLWAALIDALCYRRMPDKEVLLAMPVILLGLAVALDVPAVASALGQHRSWDGTVAGTALALLASIAFGAMLVLSQREVGDLDGRYRTAITMSVVGTLALAATLAGGGPHWPHAAAGWWALCASSLLYCCAFTMLVTLLPRLGVVGGSPVLNIEPIAVLLLAWWLLEQRVAALQLSGIAVVVSAVLRLGLRRQRGGAADPQD
jgi:drug/metabolite transporter (DMT)-like permease